MIPLPSAELQAVIRANAQDVPAEYLMSVAYWESRYHADVVNDQGFVGLCQIHPRFLADYNAQTGSDVAGADLKDPATNIRVAVWMIDRISRAWAGWYPRALAKNWRSQRWVRLLAFGYGAGWSRLGGLAKVAGYLEEHGWAASAITVERIQQYAQAAGAVEFLSMESRMKHAIRTADSYFDFADGRQIASGPSAGAGPDSPSGGAILGRIALSYVVAKVTGFIG